MKLKIDKKRTDVADGVANYRKVILSI